MFGKNDPMEDKAYQANATPTPAQNTEFGSAGDDFMSAPQPAPAAPEVTQAFTPEQPVPQEFAPAPVMDATPQAPTMPEAIAEATPEPMEAAPLEASPQLAAENAQPHAPSFSAHFGTPTTNDHAQHHQAPPAEPAIAEEAVPSFSEAPQAQEAPVEPAVAAPTPQEQAPEIAEAPPAEALATPEAPAQEASAIASALAVLQSSEAQTTLTGNGPIKSAQLEHLLVHAEQGNTGAQHALLAEGLGLLSDVAASSSTPDFGQNLKAATIALLDEGVISPISLESQQAQQQNATPEPRKPMTHQETVESAREMNRLAEENGIHTGQYL